MEYIEQLFDRYHAEGSQDTIRIWGCFVFCLFVFVCLARPGTVLYYNGVQDKKLAWQNGSASVSSPHPRRVIWIFFVWSCPLGAAALYLRRSICFVASESFMQLGKRSLYLLAKQVFFFCSVLIWGCFLNIHEELLDSAGPVSPTTALNIYLAQNAAMLATRTWPSPLNKVLSS